MEETTNEKDSVEQRNDETEHVEQETGETENDEKAFMAGTDHKGFKRYEGWLIGSHQLDPKELFSGYDWWEEYDETKTYEKEKYTHDHGHGSLVYQNTLIDVGILAEEVRYFVVAQEIVSDEEMKELVPFCPCDICSMWWFDPRQFIVCPCCVGCIKTGRSFRNNSNIKEARLRRSKVNDPK